MCVCFSLSTAWAENDVKYKRRTYEIAVFNQETAEKEISEARYVYAFKLANQELNLGNSCDNNECFFNPNTGEYAISNYIQKKGKTKYYAIIFSEERAKLIRFKLSENDNILNHLPGFEYADINEVGFVGYCSKAGYANAKRKDKHNSMIVFIK